MPSGPSGVEPSPTRETSRLYGLNGTAEELADGVCVDVVDGDGVVDVVGIDDGVVVAVWEVVGVPVRVDDGDAVSEPVSEVLTVDVADAVAD